MKNKGFTLIELLGVIVLIGLIGLIIIPPVSQTIKKSSNVVYGQTIESIELAAKNWAADNKEKLPKNEGEQIGISLNQLQNEAYIERDIKISTDDKTPCVEITNIKTGGSSKNIYRYKYNGNSNSCT